jgi:hypothetical protein
MLVCFISLADSLAENWKQAREKDLWIVTYFFSNNFWNPLGFTGYGLDGQYVVSIAIYLHTQTGTAVIHRYSSSSFLHRIAGLTFASAALYIEHQSGGLNFSTGS